MANIEIKRGYEVFPDNNVRFGIRITNTSDVVSTVQEIGVIKNEWVINIIDLVAQKVGR